MIFEHESIFEEVVILGKTRIIPPPVRYPVTESEEPDWVGYLRLYPQTAN